MSEYLLISDAAKEVKVESHVLRYWEEELNLPIKRNELGHRYYTYEDVERFKKVKNMKDQGFQLKAIRRFLTDGKLNILSETEEEQENMRKESDKKSEISTTPEIIVLEEEREKGDPMTKKELTEEKENYMDMGEGKLAACFTRDMEVQNDLDKSKLEKDKMKEEREKVSMPITIVSEENLGKGIQKEDQDEEIFVAENSSEKARRLQWLLQRLIRETLQENNRELSRDIKESIVKELDYQFRTQEEREEERERRQKERDEEYYRKIDEILRSRSFRKAAKQAGLSKERQKEIQNGFYRSENSNSDIKEKEKEKNAPETENKTIDLNSRKKKKQKFKFFLF